MTRDEARDALRALAQATVSPTLTDAELDAALTVSRLPDSAGLPPSHPDYVEENWDLNYAAAECYELKAVKQASDGTVRKFSAENASFEVDAPDFMALAAWWRSKSPTVGGSSDSPAFIPLNNRWPRYLRARSELEC